MRRDRLFVLATALAACAPTSSYRPQVDLAGVDAARYETDLYDCKRAAERGRFGPVFAGAVVGASLGAALGFVVGALAGVGNLPLAADYGAASGTEPGTLVGAAQSARQPADEPQFVDQCLRNNGYRVLAGS
jgi:hypothetical protein